MLEVRHLRLVQAVASEGGVTRAAARLHLTQSALSHQLRELESRVGAPLFLRMSRRMVPTAAGLRLVEASERLLGELARAEDEVVGLARGREGVLRLATECFTCYHWVPGVLEAFHRARPGVDVQISAEETRRPVEALLAGRIDIAIASTPVRNRLLATRPLFSDELVAVLPPSHRLASRDLLRASDFAGEHLVLYTTPADSTLYQKVLGPAGVTPARLTYVQLTEAIVELVKARVGVSVLPRWAVDPEVRAGTLRAVRITGKGLTRHWFAAYLRSPAPPEYLLEFTELMARELPRSRAGRARATA